MTQSILFVCLGNICRSPTAEAVTRAKAQARGLDLLLDSAGTGRWHINEPPYGPMQDAARAAGYDMAGLRARQVTAQDFARFDLIVAMDRDNLDDLRAMPGADPARLRLFTDYLDDAADHIPDPYYTRDFDGTLRLVERCADAMLSDLRKP